MSEVLEGDIDVLPPDVETKVVALRGLPAESQASAVTAMLGHAQAGLLTAIAAQDLPSIRDWRAKASAIQEMTKQLQLGRDMQVQAAEFVRRAERGLGVGIRDGQLAGTVETQQEARVRAGKLRHSADGSQPLAEKARPTDFATSWDLSGSGGGPGIYDLTDGISDGQFDEALTEARGEGNLSRANVARKAKAKTKPAIDADHPLIDAEVARPFRKTARGRKTVEQLAVTIYNLALGVGDIDPAEVDAEQLRSEINITYEAIGVIKRFLKEVNSQ